jgi:hypothetical protein
VRRCGPVTERRARPRTESADHARERTGPWGAALRDGCDCRLGCSRATTRWRSVVPPSNSTIRSRRPAPSRWWPLRNASCWPPAPTWTARSRFASPASWSTSRPANCGPALGGLARRGRIRPWSPPQTGRSPP